ncbi:MAG: transglycosylase SLT domain-containing protein [Pseudomonadota bacterium]
MRVQLTRHFRVCCLALSLTGSTLAHADDADWLAARSAFRAGDSAGLEQAKVAMAGSPLAIYADFWQLWRQLKNNDTAAIEAFIARDDKGYLSEKIRGEWLRQLAKQGEWQDFRVQFAKLQDASDTELQCLYWQSVLASGESIPTSNAKALRASLWLTAKDLPSACAPVQAALQDQGVITNEDRWLRLRLALEANAPGLVRHLLQQQDSDLPPDEFKDLQADPQTYIDTADLSARDQRELAAYAYGRWARTDLLAASEQLTAAAAPLAEQAAVAWRQVALAAARRFDSQTEVYFQRSEAAFWPDNHREIRLRLCVRAGDWVLYQKLYQQLPAALQDSRPWLYWQGVASAELGKAKTAGYLFRHLAQEDDYYGLLSAERLGEKIRKPAVAGVMTAQADAGRLAQHAGFQRAFALRALGQRWEAVNEFNWALRTADQALTLAAARAANDIGWYDRAIYAAEQTHGADAIQLRYLMPYKEVAMALSEERALDSAWVYGLMRQESRFVPNASSVVGAGGLMQLMPATAQWVSGKLGVPYQAEAVNDPEQNMRMGTYYLSHVLTELGHPVLATAGYNAGPRRAREWQSDFELDATRYIESIPFSETRDYAKKVMTNAVHYALALGQGETRLSVRLGSIPPRPVTVIEGP